MTLVALFALTAGAWAEEKSETFTTVKTGIQGAMTCTGEHFTISGQYADGDGFFIKGHDINPYTVTISSLNGENITKIEAVIGYKGVGWGNTVVSTPGTVSGTSYETGQTITISNINATTVTLSSSSNDSKILEFKNWTVYYASAPPFAITWSAATPNTASIDKMPAGNVTVSVDYFAQAEFAKSTGETPVALAPAAIANVPANTDAPIVTPGTVANIGTSEVKQGTLMYLVIQPTDNTVPDTPDYDDERWSKNVPTANELKQGDVYVWYYIEGAEPDNIADRTDANTRSDSDIMPLGTNGIVPLGAEPTYDVSLNKTDLAEGEPALWKAKSDKQSEVVLGTTDLKGVKKSETVTVTYSGQRKVIGVKAEKAKTINIEGQVYTVLDGETWKQFITRNQLSNWSVGQKTDTTWIVNMKDPFSTLYVSSDGTMWDPLELTSQDAPIDTDKRYRWFNAE